MNLRIEQIEYENIRDIGSLTLDFTQRDSAETCPVSLVQMPNGTGKTTTMGLLRTVILGEGLDAEEVQSYEPEAGAKSGRFTVGFATGDSRFKNHLLFNYEAGQAEYENSRIQKEGGGRNENHYMPSSLEKQLNEDMVNLFVFNGELTEEFIETDEGRAEQALKTVTRLDRIENKQKAIERLREQRKSNSDGKTQQGLRGFRTKLSKARESLQKMQALAKEYASDIEDAEADIQINKKAREQLIEEHGESIEEYRRLSTEIESARDGVSSLSNDLRGDLQVPSRIGEVFDDMFSDLLEQMDAVQLPRATSAEFFESLAEQEQCVCGRPFDDHSRQHLLESTDEYLSNEDVGVLNALKEQLKDPADPIDPGARLKEIRGARVKLQELRTERQQLDVGGEEVEQEKTELTEEIERLRNKKKRRERTMEYLKTSQRRKREKHGLDWETNIPLAKARVKKYERKIAETTGTVEFKLQSEKAEEIISDFVEQSIQKQKHQQIKSSNERLKTILKRSVVQIESIGDSIKLENKDDVSEGQSLAVAYAYLSSLFEDSTVDIPFVIDSPAVSLDHKVRGEVAPIITDLFDQIIAFVISTEKEGFVENMEPGGGEPMRYYTVYKTDEPGNVELRSDREFFMQFESEEDLPVSESAINTQD